MRSFLLVCGMVTFTAAPSFAGPLEVLDADTEAGTRTITLVLDGARSLSPASYVLRVDGDVDGVMARYVEPAGRDTPHATTLVIEDRGDVPELLERVAPMVARPPGSSMHARAQLRLVTYGTRDVVECDLLVLDDEPRVQRHGCRTHAAGRGVLDAIRFGLTELATAPLPVRDLVVIGSSPEPIAPDVAREIKRQALKAEVTTHAIVYRAPRPDTLPSVIPTARYAETLDDVTHHAYRVQTSNEQTVRVTFPTFEASTGYAIPWDGERRVYRVSTFDDGEVTAQITLPDLRVPAPAWPLPVALGAGLGGLAIGFLVGRRRAAVRVARL